MRKVDTEMLFVETSTYDKTSQYIDNSVQCPSVAAVDMSQLDPCSGV